MLRLTLLAALALTLASCGEGSADPRALLSSGGRSLSSGDYAAALADFQKADDALAGDKTNLLYLDVQKGLLRAQAGAAPSDALESLQALAGDLGDVVDVGIYSTVAGEMNKARHFTQAAEVIALAVDKFGKSPLLDQQAANIVRDAESAGTAGAGALDAMAGLGYVGD